MGVEEPTKYLLDFGWGALCEELRNGDDGAVWDGFGVTSMGVVGDIGCQWHNVWLLFAIGFCVQEHINEIVNEDINLAIYTRRED